MTIPVRFEFYPAVTKEAQVAMHQFMERSGFKHVRGRFRSDRPFDIPALQLQWERELGLRVYMIDLRRVSQGAGITIGVGSFSS